MDPPPESAATRRWLGACRYPTGFHRLPAGPFIARRTNCAFLRVIYTIPFRASAKWSATVQNSRNTLPDIFEPSPLAVFRTFTAFIAACTSIATARACRRLRIRRGHSRFTGRPTMIAASSATACGRSVVAVYSKSNGTTWH